MAAAGRGDQVAGGLEHGRRDDIAVAESASAQTGDGTGRQRIAVCVEMGDGRDLGFLWLRGGAKAGPGP